MQSLLSSAMLSIPQHVLCCSHHLHHLSPCNSNTAPVLHAPYATAASDPFKPASWLLIAVFLLFSCRISTTPITLSLDTISVWVKAADGSACAETWPCSHTEKHRGEAAAVNPFVQNGRWHPCWERRTYIEEKLPYASWQVWTAAVRKAGSAANKNGSFIREGWGDVELYIQQTAEKTHMCRHT